MMATQTEGGECNHTWWRNAITCRVYVCVCAGVWVCVYVYVCICVGIRRYACVCD